MTLANRNMQLQANHDTRRRRISLRAGLTRGAAVVCRAEMVMMVDHVERVGVAATSRAWAVCNAAAVGRFRRCHGRPMDDDDGYGRQKLVLQRRPLAANRDHLGGPKREPWHPGTTPTVPIRLSREACLCSVVANRFQDHTRLPVFCQIAHRTALALSHTHAHTHAHTSPLALID